MSIAINFKEALEGKGVELSMGIDSTAVTSLHPLYVLYRQAILANFHTVTPWSEFKCGHVCKVEGAYDWSGADIIADWARANGLNIRGHAICWHTDKPHWVNNLNPGDQISFLKNFAKELILRYKDVVNAWDVLGEFPFRFGRLSSTSSPNNWSNNKSVLAWLPELFYYCKSLDNHTPMLYWATGLTQPRLSAAASFADKTPECDGLGRVWIYEGFKTSLVGKPNVNGNKALRKLIGRLDFSEISVGYSDDTLQADYYETLVDEGYQLGARYFGFWDIADEGSPHKPGLWDKFMAPKLSYYRLLALFDSFPSE